MDNNISAEGRKSILSSHDSTKVSKTFKRRIPGFFFHYKLLLWKTLILRIREPWVILGELLLPILLVIVVVGLRHAELPKPHPPCHLVSQPLPSMGFINYAQGIICNFNFTCSPHDVDYQSRANVLPPWLRFADKNTIRVIQEVPELLRTIAEFGDKNQTTQHLSFLSDLVCETSVLKMAKMALPNEAEDKLKAFCSAPYILQGLFLRNGVSRITKYIDDAIPSEVGVFPSAISKIDSATLSDLKGKIRNASILMCGSDIGSNSFLTVFEAMQKEMSSNLFDQAEISARTMTNTTSA